MRLYLLQHGDAVPESVNPDRPLSEKGRLDVKRLARFVGWSAFKAARILHSGKLRARQSAELMASEMGEGAAPEVHPGLNPNDAVGPVASEAAGWQQDVLIVGHMPFLGRLAAQLVCGNPE
ncbi:MAG TPA: phosphohistidine phosphatase SixA, partial [Burkholderiales bacterium]|nr:phosphohistidine phosphatase SixA [Burkholderiales bacterium]